MPGTIRRPTRRRSLPAVLVKGSPLQRSSEPDAKRRPATLADRSIGNSAASGDPRMSIVATPLPVLELGHPLLRRACDPVGEAMADPALRDRAAALQATLAAFRAR